MKIDSTAKAPTEVSSKMGTCTATDSTLSPELLGSRLRAARINKGWTQEQAGEAVGLSRLALLQIEAGTRAVSSLELRRLSRCYGRQIEEFLGETEAEDDLQLVLGRIDAAAPPGWRAQIAPFFEQLKEAVTLSQSIGEHTAVLPPLYQFAEPCSYKEAIEQGREMAVLERKRLDLGSASVDDVAAVISSQFIWTAAVPFPSSISGLFVRHLQYGLAVLINCEHSRVRRRFSYSHEYAHALVDRDKVAAPTSRQNANELVEKRANAFASEFLMPEAGVWEALERMQKGAASREYSLLYDVASGEILPHETRNDALSQRISASEIAVLAHTFKVSYDVAAYRLSDIGAIRRSQLEELLTPAQRENGRQLVVNLQLYDGNEEDNKEQPHLKRQLALLAIEARRRGKITDSNFHRICEEVAGFNPEQTEQLLRVARSMV